MGAKMDYGHNGRKKKRKKKSKWCSYYWQNPFVLFALQYAGSIEFSAQNSKKTADKILPVFEDLIVLPRSSTPSFPPPSPSHPAS